MNSLIFRFQGQGKDSIIPSISREAFITSNLRASSSNIASCLHAHALVMGTVHCFFCGGHKCKYENYNNWLEFSNTHNAIVGLYLAESRQLIKYLFFIIDVCYIFQLGH